MSIEDFKPTVEQDATLGRPIVAAMKEYLAGGGEDSFESFCDVLENFLIVSSMILIVGSDMTVTEQLAHMQKRIKSREI